MLTYALAENVPMCELMDDADDSFDCCFIIQLEILRRVEIILSLILKLEMCITVWSMVMSRLCWISVRKHRRAFLFCVLEQSTRLASCMYLRDLQSADFISHL